MCLEKLFLNRDCLAHMIIWFCHVRNIILMLKLFQAQVIIAAHPCLTEYMTLTALLYLHITVMWTYFVFFGKLL